MYVFEKSSDMLLCTCKSKDGHEVLLVRYFENVLLKHFKHDSEHISYAVDDLHKNGTSEVKLLSSREVHYASG